jgi:hypothetical protein
MNFIRWNIAALFAADQSVRVYLGSQGDHKGDLSRFLNEAERAHVLELTAAQAKAANVNIGEADLMSIVSEAVHWTREHACASSQTSISW